MTQEEKAKAYDEALERFKSFKERYYTRNTHFGDVIFDKNGEMQKDFEEIFPQLRESEDERIRKELIKGFKFCKRIGVGKGKSSSWAGTNLNMDEIIAWLEKQKEQKPWKVGANAYFTPEQKSEEVDESTKRLNDNWMKQHFDDYKEQKPAWSEEDVDMLNSCISSIEEAKENRYAYKETDGDTSYDHEIAWLKSLRPQPKQEWSEEDEEMLEEIINHIDTTSVQRIPARPGSAIGKSWIKFLKSLRPSWRPSEVHLNALLAVFNDPNNISSQTCQLALTDLYEQLKKL